MSTTTANPEHIPNDTSTRPAISRTAVSLLIAVIAIAGGLALMATAAALTGAYDTRLVLVVTGTVLGVLGLIALLPITLFACRRA